MSYTRIFSNNAATVDIKISSNGVVWAGVEPAIGGVFVAVGNSEHDALMRLARMLSDATMEPYRKNYAEARTFILEVAGRCDSNGML